MVGDSFNSEVKSGFDYASVSQGIEGTTGASKIGRIRVRGALVDSVVAASYRPGALGYGRLGSVAGPGTITGTQDGVVLRTGAITALGNRGAGFFARNKSAGLPGS